MRVTKRKYTRIKYIRQRGVHARSRFELIIRASNYSRTVSHPRNWKLRKGKRKRDTKEWWKKNEQKKERKSDAHSVSRIFRICSRPQTTWRSDISGECILLAIYRETTGSDRVKDAFSQPRFLFRFGEQARLARHLFLFSFSVFVPP